MKKSIKAALMSALLFPGIGHIYLKKNLIGVGLIIVSISAIYVFITRAMEKAFEITDQLLMGNIPMDVAEITELVEKQTTGLEAQSLDMATAVIIICWLFGIIDSYRVGSRMK